MRGTVSFHPLDLAFFDATIGRLFGGGKVNPQAWVDAAVRVRRAAWQARRYARALEYALAAAEPLPVAVSGGALLRSLRSEGLLRNLKRGFERLTWRPDAVAARAQRLVDPDLHLRGRPFFVTEGSPEGVAGVVDDYVTAGENAADSLGLEQLVRLDPGLARDLEPLDGSDLSADFAYRNDLLGELRAIYDLGAAAREGGSWGRADGPRGPAREAVLRELPWRAVALHSRARPFWIADDVDGLDTVCRAAGVDPPDVLVPAWRPFAEACDAFPELRESLTVELAGDRDVGGFVSPSDVPAFLDFLNASGSLIIAEASRQGEGARCRTLLRKIRECAVYAERHGHGYVEAVGIAPPDLEGELGG